MLENLPPKTETSKLAPTNVLTFAQSLPTEKMSEVVVLVVLVLIVRVLELVVRVLVLVVLELIVRVLVLVVRGDADLVRDDVDVRDVVESVFVECGVAVLDEMMVLCSATPELDVLATSVEVIVVAPHSCGSQLHGPKQLVEVEVCAIHSVQNMHVGVFTQLVFQASMERLKRDAPASM